VVLKDEFEHIEKKIAGVEEKMRNVDRLVDQKREEK
jgi:tetrahydromethanopterin S-methyltransferase subunit G